MTERTSITTWYAIQAGLNAGIVGAVADSEQNQGSVGIWVAPIEYSVIL